MNINQTYGSYTAKRVTDLQEYYGLPKTGKGDSKTLDKLIELMSSPYQEGKKHKDVTEFKVEITTLGLGGININQTYSNIATRRVKELQSYYGLAANGILDEPTRNKIDQILSISFQEGDKHKDIINFKEKITTLGFGGMNINETYGSFTVTRVKQLQAYYGLIENGIADERTIAKIDEILSSPFQEGKKHNDRSEERRVGKERREKRQKGERK